MSKSSSGSEEESLSTEDDPNGNINQSTRYLQSLKNQYDELVKEGELVKKRKMQYAQFRVELDRLIDEKGKLLKNPKTLPKIPTTSKDINELQLQKFEIVVPAYKYEQISIN